MEELAANATIPVINALSDKFHPCQALALGLTLQEHLPDIKKATIVFVGDGNNVANCIMVLCAKLGYNFVLACPKGYELENELAEEARSLGGKACYSVVHNPDEAVSSADVVYTDTWVSIRSRAQ